MQWLLSLAGWVTYSILVSAKPYCFNCERNMFGVTARAFRVSYAYSGVWTKSYFCCNGLVILVTKCSWQQGFSHFVVLSASVSSFFEEPRDCVGILCCQRILNQWKKFAYFGNIRDWETCPVTVHWIKFLNKSTVQMFNHISHSISAEILAPERKCYSSWDEWD